VYKRVAPLIAEGLCHVVTEIAAKFSWEQPEQATE